ncbi:hypothetical protein FACS1894159_00270 [Bacteroidia bacterium]|nr:hypothetical protein FACS1894159_00270 [Bacteroidia bacterium]
MMYNVYYRDKALCFSAGPQSGSLNLATDEIGVTKLLQKVGNNKHLTLISPDPGQHFERFCGQFALVHAAGGVVDKPSGELLLIFRNRVWDLPKGHLEQGESLAECALREVGEECGLSDLSLGREICTTRHFYRVSGGGWELKQTAWFAMTATGDTSLTPQTEEGITQVRWVAPTEAIALTSPSYQTVIRVLGKYFE